MDELKIVADYREFPSGIPTMLLENNIETSLENLKAGDYFINGEILVERKTAEDFVQSLISNRLFPQCEKLKRASAVHFIIIEGNPYKTNHKIRHEAVKGALLSVSVAWQIPVLFSKDKTETIEILIKTGKQMFIDKIPKLRKGHKPKNPKNQQLYLLQGLPKIGPALAHRLLLHFGSLLKTMKATEKQLVKVNGIGKTKAHEIVGFINRKF
ncbi:MAG: multidrug MFS transporter [Chlorobi bacterium]|nr:multidrug MFS transporter [Chlorobiota bacterium]